MPTFVPQRLELRPETFAVERHDTEDIVATGDWVALVRGSEGLTVIRVVDDSPDGWRAFAGQTAHELDVPGMLLSIVAPLSAADLPVFVASTYDADLVLVPAAHAAKAAELLRDAGHDVKA
ncbi:ACT domain-containing protein [Cryptosporangium phraense]|uniref:ACT domain-containing protein n=1 Tax=Cryptosporangium phraense TaxID=2593070 RepID=A0A545AT51_9ACTN|nr:ACT domain-containing protein [Cryptosporangium phraense]TQS44520.1 ACT domain-containing protein [Cryptosporangium phraense]